MRVAIVENTRVTHHGLVGVALHEAAAVIDLYKPWLDGVLPPRGSFDALISFGGEQTARDDHSHPYLPALGALMAEAAAGGTAVLGICLGAQVFARGLGADNHLGSAPEMGWCAVTRRNEATEDAVMGALPDWFSLMQWHSDTFDLPPGATHLAVSAVAPVQCYRYGRAGYGMQFHFEASRAVARDWCRQLSQAMDVAAPGWRADYAAHEAAHGAAADGHGLAIARAWVGLI